MNTDTLPLLLVSEAPFSIKKSFLRNLTKFTRKHPWQSLFFNKIAGLRPTSLLKKGLCHRCFSLNFCEIPKNTFFYKTPLVTASVTFWNKSYCFGGICFSRPSVLWPHKIFKCCF